MSRTFYGVLGVGPDADEEAIRAAYRERVKEHHPDVSSDPDAADRFRRLTAAKETLLDVAERARYDRLGHRAYVQSHADSTLWAADPSAGPTASTTRGSTTEASDTRGASADARTTTGSDAAAGHDGAAADRGRTGDATNGSSRGGSNGTWAGRTGANRRSSSRRRRRRTGDRTRSDGARRSGSSRSNDTAASSTGDDADPSSTADPGPSSATDLGDDEASSDTCSTGEDPSNGDGNPDDTGAGGSGSAASTTAHDGRSSGTAKAGSASAATDGVSARAGGAGRGSESGDRRRRRASGGTANEATTSQRTRRRRRASGGTANEATTSQRTRRRRRSPTGSYATTSFWGVTEDRTSEGRSSNPVTRRALAALRRLGPWILVHALFLSLAVGTGWYVYTVVLPPAERSVALLFVLIGEVGLAVVLSSLHILSRLYR